ncbi:MAG TPA: alpha-L-fucosidase [Gemmatimonadales bacterium]|jgi:alpha-L-fucosidase|nr:alpha-L-fucosidase [Gemmatimonadales bacterium]
MTPMTRRGFLAAGSAALLLPRGVARGRPAPSRPQLEWQQDELAIFLHFGVNTFTDREWGDGREDPASFAPTKLDARQWARAAKTGGFRAMILTAKHHDGFCLWPSRTTRHSVASSPWREGKGDLVREFTAACRAEGLKAGLYLSPWDRNNPAYGDSPRYNELYCDQLTELLTQYGPIHEVWFDGANGEGPNGKRQVYDWPRFWGLVRQLQPKAVMFSDAGPDIRWIGNERGVAGETNWSTMDPAAVPYPGADGPGIIRALQQGDPSGTVWRPGETDVSIRPGWFYHPAEDAKVKTVEDLVGLYFTSVGRNSKLLLNVPPTREGLLHDIDAARLRQLRIQLDIVFRDNVAEGSRVRWRPLGARSAAAELDLGRLRTVGIAELAEDIRQGQRVARYRLEGSDGGAWKPLASGTTIGYRKLDRFEPARMRRVRLYVEDAVDAPRPVRIRLFSGREL